jgi:hypothetical protein
MPPEDIGVESLNDYHMSKPRGDRRERKRQPGER